MTLHADVAVPLSAAEAHGHPNQFALLGQYDGAHFALDRLDA